MMYTYVEKLSQIFDADLDQLLELQFNKNFNNELNIYIQVLIAFLSGRNDDLNILISKCNKNHPNTIITKLAQLRKMIRSGTIEFKLLNNLIESVERNNSFFVFQGEVYFLSARSFSIKEDYKKAKLFYKKAYISFTKIKAHNKALKCLLNHVVAESRINPNKRLLVEYKYIIKKALKIDQFGIAGHAYLNCSREYQMIGAYDVAYEHCEKALKLSEQGEFGTLHYYMLLTHRCHLNIDLGNEYEAYSDYQKIKTSTHQEVKNAVKVIDAILSKNNIKLKPNMKLVPSWKERLANLKADTQSSTLTPIENKIINYISVIPKTKNEIITYLYGNKLNYLSLENRFKVALSRLRKKNKNLINLRKGKYSLMKNY